MTRDEAIQIMLPLYRSPYSDDKDRAKLFVEVLCGLGLLKLDDRVETAAIDRLRDAYFHFNSSSLTNRGNFVGKLTLDGAAEVVDVLLKSGFKITR